MSIKISRNSLRLKVETFIFPCGEVGVKIQPDFFAYNYEKCAHQVIARIRSSNDVMELVMAVDALRHMFVNPPVINLVLPYVPYARQDRASNKGESCSVSAFAKIINGLGFNSVTVFDPHSDVTPAVIERCTVIDQAAIISRFEALNVAVLSQGYELVSPDAGANKKTFAIAKYFNRPSFIRADKVRDTQTGAIKETVIHCDNLNGAPVMIIDDICDGGRTFTELAKALKSKGAGKVGLYVTHGAFTKGTDVLYHGGIDEIYTTNSFHDTYPQGVSENVKTLNIEQAFSL